MIAIFQQMLAIETQLINFAQTQTKTSSRFYASNLYPLWTDSYDSLDLQLASRAVNYVKQMGVFNYENGVPTSLVKGNK